MRLVHSCGSGCKSIIICVIVLCNRHGFCIFGLQYITYRYVHQHAMNGDLQQGANGYTYVGIGHGGTAIVLSSCSC